jgi:hypothetical protein
MMQTYANYGRDSGVKRYEIGPDSIVVVFKDRKCYLYNYESTGVGYVEDMKRLAAAGRGLNSFIKRRVAKRFARKWSE